MRSILNKRPSAGTALSIVAIFMAMGGTSYAAAHITSAQVKNGSLTGADIKNNSVGGADVKESKLGQVPKAAQALQAAKAAQADKAGQADQAQKAAQADTALKADSADTVKDDSITSSKVADRSLTAADTTLANGSPTVDLPNIPANDCAYSLVPAGTNLNGATVSVSAGESAQFANGGLSIHAAKSNVQTSFRLSACNVTGADINPGPAEFDWTAVK
jgi:hypothetical protein